MNQEQRAVLIIDSDEVTRDQYRHYLRHDAETYTILDADSGQVGLELWQQRQPDVVILEYWLPDCSGLDVLAELKTRSRQLCLPVVMVTEHGNEQIAVQAMKAGVSDYLVKGQLTADELCSAVKHAIANTPTCTQLRQVEMALDAANQRILANLEHMTDAYVMIDREWRVIYANQAAAQVFQQLTQLEPDAFLGRSYWDLFPSLAGHSIEQTYRQAMRDQVPVHFEICYEPTGNWFEVHAYPTAEGLGIYFRDISTAKRNEAATADVNSILQAVINGTNDVIFVKDLQGRYVLANQAAAQWLNTTVELMMGQDDTALFPADVAQSIQVLDQHVIQTGELITYEEQIPKDQQLRSLLSTKYPWHNDRGEVVGMIGIAVDITERKQAEVQLQESRHFIQQIAETVPGIVYVYDLIEQRNVYVNQQVTKLLGHTPAQVQAMGANLLPTLIHPEDFAQVPTHIAQLQSALDGEIFELEYRMQHLSGEWRWFTSREVVFSRTAEGLLQQVLGISQDITNRKQAEMALQQSEDRLRLALIAADQGWYDLNIQTGATIVSPEYAQMLGYDPVTFQETSANWRARLHPEDRERVSQAYDEYIAGQRDHYHVEFRQRTQSGAWKWILSVGRIVAWDQDGQPLRMLGIHTDISDRKRTEDALQSSEEQLRLATIATNLGMWFWDLTLDHLQWTDQCKALFGLSPETVISYEAFLNALHPDDRERTHSAVTRSIEDRADYNIEYRTVWPDGTTHWLLAKGRAFYNPDGQPVKMMGTVQDISDRKQADQDLQDALQKLNFHVENSPLAVIEWNHEFRVTRWSLEAERMFGWRAEEVMGKHSSEWSFIVEDDTAAVTDVVTRLSAGTEQRNISHNRNYTKEGTLLHCEWYNSRLLDAAGRLVSVLSLVQNVSDRVRLLAERDRVLQLEQTARKEAERSNRIKDEFLAVLSHELRSPLNPILSWAQLLQRRQFSAAKTAEALATIERNAKLQTQLVDDLLDVAKIMRGKLTLNSVPLDLTSTLRAAIETVQVAATAKSITIYPVLSNIGQVVGDSTRLQQVIWNLLTNAIKFTPPGGRIDICLEQVEHQAQITVTDTGKGITPDFLPYIFEHFRQEDASITRKFGGLGLGLAIVRSLVEAHGGTITAASPGEGLGATFTVMLPLLNAESSGELESQLANDDLNLAGIRVLAIDDEPDTCELLTILLEAYGAESMVVTSASDVFTALQAFRPHVFISDIGMPNVDGYTLLTQVRSLSSQQGGQVPAIAMTAYAKADDQQRAYAAGFQRHIPKPIEPDQLVAEIIALTQGSDV
jgi:PAS domain S-box-containing protein